MAPGSSCPNLHLLLYSFPGRSAWQTTPRRPPSPHGAVTSNKEEQGVLWTDSLGPSGESWPHRHWVMSGINTHTLQWTHTHTSLMLTRTAVSSTEQPETVGLSGPKFPKCHVSSLRRHGTVGVHREFIPKKKCIYYIFFKASHYSSDHPHERSFV